MNRGNEPAYPIAYNFGMTLREHYAGLAMQGLLSNPGRLPRAEVEGGPAAYARMVAAVSLEFSDALLAALAKDPTP